MEATKRAVFLRKIHLFHDLNDDQLVEIAEKTTEVSFDTDGVILEQGAVGDSFYLIYSGKVRVFFQSDGSEQTLATLVSGDYFGEMELFTGRGRSATVTAMESTTLLRFSKEYFHELLQSYPSIEVELDIAIASRRLARSKKFKWLGPDEVVYFLARKSQLFLLEVLIVPVLTLLLPAFLLLWGGLVLSIATISFGVVALVFILGWIAWRYIDWGNDYYIVTNQRVIWLEKVVGLYDSRTEAPLSEVLSVGVETDIFGRALDHGNVFVRTFVGEIPFKHVHHPHQAAHMVEEYWHRTQKASEQAEKEAFKHALRKSLNLLNPPKDEKAPPKEEKKARAKRPNLFKMFIINLFRQRIEEGDRITYRKHWYVLLKQIFIPSAILLVLLGLAIALLYARNIDTALSLPFLMIPILIWWVYQYMDWSNDIFRVTSDQIYDIDKKPFGNEQSRAAPIDNILSTRYERVGFLGYFLNFGTVYIDVGSAHFAFEDVLDPATVQTDIDRRRLKRISAKKASERETERNRMADWMAAYHHNVDELRKEQELRNAKSKNG